MLGAEQSTYERGQDGVPWFSLSASWTLHECSGDSGRKTGPMRTLYGGDLGT